MKIVTIEFILLDDDEQEARLDYVTGHTEKALNKLLKLSVDYKMKSETL